MLWQLMEPDDQLHLIGREPLDISGCHYIATGKVHFSIVRAIVVAFASRSEQLSLAFWGSDFCDAHTKALAVSDNTLM